MEAAGLTTPKYTTHSFRVGFAVSQALQGNSSLDIMRRVFWKSEVVAKRYADSGASREHQQEVDASTSVDAERVHGWIDKFAASQRCAGFALFPVRKQEPRAP